MGKIWAIGCKSCKKVMFTTHKLRELELNPDQAFMIIDFMSSHPGHELIFTYDEDWDVFTGWDEVESYQ